LFDIFIYELLISALRFLSCFCVLKVMALMLFVLCN